MARLLIIITLVITTLGVHRTAAATNNAGNTWKVQNPPFPIVGLQTVACPSPTVCQAAGMDTIFSTQDGGVTWQHKQVHPGSQISQVVCVSISSCFVLDDVFHGQQSQGVVVRTQDGGRTWTDTATFTQTLLSGASCPSPTICYALGTKVPLQNAPVQLLRSDDGGASWSSVQGQPLYSVSIASLACTGPDFCYLGGTHSILVTRDGGLTWSKRDLGASASPQWSVSQIDCIDADRCYAMFGNGRVIGTRDGWATSHVLQPGSLSGATVALNRIACPALSVCYASAPSGAILATTNDGATWQTLKTGSSNFLQAIACSTPSTCTAVGENSTILSTPDGGATWHQGLPGTTNALSAVTCVDASTCVVVGAAGTILVTANGGQVWKMETSGVDQWLEAASCPTTTVCYAVGGTRYIVQSQGPVAPAAGPVILRTNDGGTNWTVLARAPIGGRPLDLAGIACPAANICYATSDSGSVLSTTDGGRSWQWGRTGAYFQLRGIACPSTTHCLAVGGLDAECNSLRRSTSPSAFRDLDGCVAPEEGVIFVTQDGGHSWQRRFYRQVDMNGPSVTDAHLYSISCATPAICLAAGHNIVVKTLDGGQTWHRATTPSPGMGGWPNAVSLACPSATMCWGAFGGSTLSTTQDGGRSWSFGPANPKSRAGPVFALTCPGLDTCYAVGSSGLILRFSGKSSVPSDPRPKGVSPIS